MHNSQITSRFEGRPLAKPEEDVEDQGLAFDITTISNRLSRRGFLSLLGIGAGSAALAACSPAGNNSSVDLAETVTETAGPYPGDGSNGPDVLEKVGVERKDIRGSIGGGATANGVPLNLKMRLVDVQQGGPMAGAAVYVWHADAQGRYSMHSSEIENETYLRGVQVSDDSGNIEFTTIIPGCYDGRWPHIHFEVFPSINDISDASKNVLTSQIAIPEEVGSAVYTTDNYTGSAANFATVSLEQDNVFSDGWDTEMPTYKGNVQAGYEFSIDVGIDPSTEQQQSMGPANPSSPKWSSQPPR